ncbi:hypothetical protein QNK01_11565 (plasmid) [Desemzia incerta]|uniref:hypothetical protein n=1 Tax=Desemzia incerta TaxID=82801 RepID=UPI0024C37205|nr:hypothetical protein [Desemzia incerta]WHZ33223.1 hypothetical protein QNK01_11565 [Desemzia incerta]
MVQTTNSTFIITRELLDNYPIPPELSPSEFVKTYWSYYTSNYKSNNSVNGTILENLIIIALAREGIKNIYYQTEVSFVPSAKFDVFLYNDEVPIALSIKTSLRERWKQADLEAAALKQVHKEAESYVLTISAGEVATRRKMDRTYAGIDGFILADTPEFDKLVERLKGMTFTKAGSVPVIKSENRYYTPEILSDNFHFKP